MPMIDHVFGSLCGIRRPGSMLARGRRGIGQTLSALSVTLCVLLAAPALALAQEAAETAAESRSAAFQAVEGAVQEDIAGGPLLLATYGVIWLVLFAYVFRLVSLQRRTQAELDSLRQELAEGPAPGN